MINATAIFCEDIRAEKSGTETIVGVFPDNINVPSFPGMMPKLGVYVRIHVPTDEDLRSVRIELVDADEDQSVLADIDEDFLVNARKQSESAGQSYIGMIVRSVMSPFPVQRSGRINVYIRVDEGQPIIIGTLKLSQTPSAAPPLPKKGRKKKGQ